MDEEPKGTQTLAHTHVHTLILLLWGFLPRHGTPIGLCLMQLLQCQLAVQTLCLFVDVEGTGFSRKASQALPLLSCYLSPASQMEAGRGGEEEGTDEETQNGGEEVTQGREEEEGGESSAAMETDAAEGIMCNDRCPLVGPSLGADTEPPVAHDHLLFTTLTCLGKMLSACSALIRSPALQVSMNEIWGKLMLLYVCTQHGCCSHTSTHTSHCFPLIEQTEALLLHPHAWVRLASARLTGLLFATYKPEELASGVNQGGEYLLESTTEKVGALHSPRMVCGCDTAMSCVCCVCMYVGVTSVNHF